VVVIGQPGEERGSNIRDEEGNPWSKRIVGALAVFVEHAQIDDGGHGDRLGSVPQCTACELVET